MRRLHAAGRLSPAQALVMAETRPVEELYDLREDPHELRNLAGDPAHRKALERMREALEHWIAATGDRGCAPESPAMYDSDMAVYAPRNATIRENIELMKRWAAEGR